MREAAIGVLVGLGAASGVWAPTSVSAAGSEIRVLFVESAPKDSFTIMNNAGCALSIASLTIDLDGSAGNLIFDTTAQGLGVSVYQPFELVSGGDRVTAVTDVTDGDRAVTFTFTGLETGESARFTIDVDDQLTSGPMGQTMIAGSEIQGAKVTATLSGPTGAMQTVEAEFDDSSSAVVNFGHCAVS